jgi:hypothetical protein
MTVRQMGEGESEGDRELYRERERERKRKRETIWHFEKWTMGYKTDRLTRQRHKQTA